MWKHKYGWLGSLEFVGSTENICELNLILLKKTWKVALKSWQRQKRETVIK